jgi:hypothetical protein
MNYRLDMPVWPNADLQNYIRYFGKVERRVNGGVHQWPGEQLFCKSQHAINLKQLTKQRIVYNPTSHSLFKCRYRRFFSNGVFTNRFELGFTTDVEKILLDKKLKKGDENFDDIFNRIIQHFLGLEVKIKKNKEDEFDDCQLYNAGQLLSYLYSKGSTSKFYKEKIKPWWVKAGDPIGLIIHEDGPFFKLPKYTNHVESFLDHGIRLRFVYYKIRKDKFIKIWLIGVDPGSRKKDSGLFLRQLRINLLRINAEKETLRNVLNAIDSKMVDIDNDDDIKTTLTTYLSFISEKLLTPIRFGIPQDKILDAAILSDNTVNQGDFETLLAQLGPVENKYLKKNLTSLKNVFVINKEVSEINIQTLVPEGVTQVDNVVKNFNEIKAINITEKGDIIKQK